MLTYPSTRAEAVASGAKRFFTAIPCAKGHLAARFTATNICVECSRLKTKAWHEAHKEYANARQKERNRAAKGKPRILTPEQKARKAERERLRRAKNPDAHLAATRRYRKANPDYGSASQSRRRQRKLNAEGRHTLRELREIRSAQKDRCAYCRKPLLGRGHKDHIQPLSKGGTDWAKNIQFLCKPCNLAKKDTDPIEFAKRIGRLI